jgi:REP-associated tyrosine transposase
MSLFVRRPHIYHVHPAAVRREASPDHFGLGGPHWPHWTTLFSPDHFGYNPPMQFEFFDPQSEFTITYGQLPHWDQPGVMCFITWRTIDSIPEATLRRWRIERTGWLRRHGIDSQAATWRDELRSLSAAVRREYHEHFTSPWMECLDECHGECVLRRPELASIVALNLLHGDGSEYELSDFVVMPNHVHLLGQFRSEGAIKRCCRDWKHYTARRIHEELGRRGHFWQTESFDHLVRSPEQFEYLRRYIERNPVAAGLHAGEYRDYRK